MGLDGFKVASPMTLPMYYDRATAVAPERMTSADPRVTTLTGDALVQILSHVVSKAALGNTRRIFEAIAASTDAAGAEVLLLPRGDGHDAPGDPRAIARFDITGDAAAEHFLGQWLPLPCLRATGRSGQAAFGDGPSNWARILITHDTDAGSPTATYRVTLAFDTTLFDPARGLGRADLAPTRDDVRIGQLFRVPTTPEHVEWFVTEPWVEDWLDDASRKRAADLGHRDDEGEQPDTLSPLAHYLTLMAALATAAILPDVRFAGSALAGTSDQDIAPTARDLDLIVALGTDTTAAALSDRMATATASTDAVVPLAMRDRDRPWITRTGPMPAAAAFAPTTFGNEVLSRQSGRADAFASHSLLRVGFDAQELLRRHPADAPSCGLPDPIGHIGDTSPNDGIWRFGAIGAADDARRPFATGTLLGRVTETGEPLSSVGSNQGATRARFAPAALTAFAINEVVQHAVAAIHAVRPPRNDDVVPVPRRLGRIIVSLPDHLFAEDVAEARRRVAHGVALAAQARATPGHEIAMPEIVFAPGPALCLQHAYLHNEVAFKFANRATAYLRMIVNPFATPQPETAVARIGTLVVDATALTFLVSTASVDPDATGRITITPEQTDSGGIGSNTAAWAVARRFIVPAVVEHFAKARMVDAAAFVETLLSARDPSIQKPEARVANRFAQDVLLPAARALLRLHEQTPVGAAASMIETPLRTLVNDIDVLPAAIHVQDAAIAEGANPISLGEAVLRATPEQVGAAALDSIEPAVRSALGTLRRARCDVLLLSGSLGLSPVLRRLALEEAVARPDRTIDLTNYRFGAWSSIGDSTGRHTAMASLVCAGAAAAGTDRAPRHRLPIIIGIADDTATIADTDVLFTVEADADTTAEPPPRQSQVVGFSGAPLTLAVRRVNRASWPGRGLAVLQAVDAAAVRRAALPLAVTLQFDPSLGLSIDSLRIKVVRDARGRDLPPSLLSLARTGMSDRHAGTVKGQA